MDRQDVKARLKSRLKQFAPLLISVGIALVFATSLIIIESDAFEYGLLSKKGLIHYLDLKSLDIKFGSRTVTKQWPEPKVVVAAIDEKTVDRYGLWPFSRAVIGEFVTKATQGGAKVVAFDAVFGDEDRNASWRNIKRFEEAYREAQLLPDSPLGKQLEAAVLMAESLKEQSREALGKAMRDRGGPQVALAIRAAEKAYDKSQKDLDAARQTLAQWQERSTGFYQLMHKEVASLSPDDAFAAAIAKSPQTIMGFIAFYDEKDVVGGTSDKAKSSIHLLDPVAITSIFESTVQQAGGQEIEITQPLEGIDLAKMQIRSMVGVLSPIEKLAKASQGFAYFNVSPDPDGPMRRVWLLHRYGNKLYPALSLLSAARYFDAEIRPLNGTIKPGLTIDGIAALDSASGQNIPTDPHGRMFINYYGDPLPAKEGDARSKDPMAWKGFPTYSLADIIDGTVPPEIYKDKVLIFGGTAQGTFDQRATPFSPNMPGVYVHAMAIQNIIDGNYLQRWFGLAIVEALVYLLLGVLLGLVLPRVPGWAGMLVSVGFITALYFIDIMVVFPRGTWMLNILPTLQTIATFLGITVYSFFTEGREKRQIRKAFQFYLTKSVVDEVLKDPTRLKLGGEKKICTVMFSDVRGFTTISEKLSPEALVALLNSYLTPMTDIVYKYDGTLDKYIGDAIMAIFGAPVASTDHATRACRVCLEMMAKLHELQPLWREQGLPELDIGIGLNTGPMSAGNMGSSQRFDYTVMGDNVNLASRLEGINKSYGTNIIISESTFDAARNEVYVREMDLVRVKGKKEPVKIFELLGQGTPTQAHHDLMGEFTRAIMLYREQKWDESVAAFELVRTKLKPKDYASGMYIERCEKMRAHPPGADWDGVYTFTTK